MRVLHIHPLSHESLKNQCTLPVGLVSIGNMLVQNGFDYKIINYPLKIVKNADFDLKKVITQYAPNVVMIDLQWAVYSYYAIETAKQVKAIDDNIIVVLGGITATVYCGEILSSYNYVDYVICGEGEMANLQLLGFLKNKTLDVHSINNLAYRKDGAVVVGEVKNCVSLCDLNFYNYDFVEDRDFLFEQQFNACFHSSFGKLAWIPLGRGCCFNCSYCGGNCNMFADFYGYNKMILNTPKSMFNTIKCLYEKYGIKTFGFTHDFSKLNEKNFDEFLSMLKTLPFKIGFVNYLCQLPSCEFFQKLVEVIDVNNSILGLSVICGNDETRLKNGKFFTNEQVFNVLEILKCFNVRVEIYLNDIIIDSDKSFKFTIDFINLLYEKFGDTNLNFNVSYTLEVLQVGSELSKSASGKHATLKSFADYYRRYSPSFNREIIVNKRYADIVGLEPYDKNCVARIKIINKLIKDLKTKYSKG